MSNTVYSINKGVNEPVKFKGLQAQYIWYLGGALVGLLLLFAILYLVGVNTFLCVGLIGAGGTLAFTKIYRMSKTYGQYGLMKKTASRMLPTAIRFKSRVQFIKRVNGKVVSGYVPYNGH